MYRGFNLQIKWALSIQIEEQCCGIVTEVRLKMCVAVTCDLQPECWEILFSRLQITFLQQCSDIQYTGCPNITLYPRFNKTELQMNLSRFARVKKDQTNYAYLIWSPFI